MKLISSFTQILSVFLCLLLGTFFTMKASESNQANEFSRLLQEYSVFEHSVRENQGTELVSSPQAEHLSRMQNFPGLRQRYTTEELNQFADHAQFTFCQICAWAQDGYPEETPNTAYILAYRNHQVAQIQGNFYYKAALFINSESRHNQQDFKYFGYIATQCITNLKELARQSIREQE